MLETIGRYKNIYNYDDKRQTISQFYDDPWSFQDEYEYNGFFIYPIKSRSYILSYFKFRDFRDSLHKGDKPISYYKKGLKYAKRLYSK